MEGNSKVTVVMYHYIRDLKNSKYPEIKGLDVKDFTEQIAYMNKHYCFITMEHLIAAIDGTEELPEKAILLSFDDGYTDHFEYVYPVLEKNGIQGSFYMPVRALTENRVLDVNKIHFILASESDKNKIIREIKNELKTLSKDYELMDFDYYYEKLAKPSRYDIPEVVFIKRLLQVELKEPVKSLILNKLFEKVVGEEESTFSRELYMDISQIQTMKKSGMHFGSHGYDHFWLGSLSRDEQMFEITQSLEFLKSIGCDMEQWTMCYPYGNYNDTTIDLLGSLNCKLALTTEVKVGDIANGHRFKVPRLDATDIPKDRNAEPNKWFIEA
jgi:peptidoglycan/xylan/chitin deacetylase (PgdA/CDA1 family)